MRPQEGICGGFPLQGYTGRFSNRHSTVRRQKQGRRAKEEWGSNRRVANAGQKGSVTKGAKGGRKSCLFRNVERGGKKERRRNPWLREIPFLGGGCGGKSRQRLEKILHQALQKGNGQFDESIKRARLIFWKEADRIPSV